MTWYVMYEDKDGRLETESDTEIKPQEGKTVLEFETRPNVDVRGVMWDEATRSFIPRPQKILVDRLDDLQANPDFQQIRDVLDEAGKTKLQDIVIGLLGKERLRNANESVEVDE